MNVFVIGSGGREHALVWKIVQSPLVSKVYCAPGNPGIAGIAENVPVSAGDFDQLVDFARKKKIDLTVVGPEDPLANGIVDTFRRHGLIIFGPDKNAARLEGSKTFAKNLMRKYQIPTADYQTFSTVEAAMNFLHSRGKYPVVLKAGGLAAGKGVLICSSLAEADAGIRLIMEERAFGSAGDEVVIEDFLDGEEISIFAICDGHSYLLLSPSQDHKKALDEDMGKNTGGMGAYAPAPLATRDLIADVRQ
jgi:phosphoribosylamine--glycine ligase